MENVDHPKHYNSGKIECIDAMESATENMSGTDAICTASVIKYIWRWKYKGGYEDLEKAKWYIERLMNKERERDEY